MSDLRALVSDLARTGLSAQADAIARAAFVDTCAALLAGLGSHQAQAVRRMQAGARADSAMGRALWLGTAAHALDFDDYEDVGSTHPSACLVAALLAVAEGRDFSTGAMLAAYVQGYEAILSFGQAMGHAHYLAGWHATSTLGGIGAAASVAHLLGLSADKTVMALSMACTLAGGFKRQFGSDTKALHCGLAAKNGVETALLAQAGMTARSDVLDGAYGFLSMFSGQSPDWPNAAQPRIEDHAPYAKLWPSCAYTHRAVEAALQLAPKASSDQIKTAQLHMAAPYHDVAGNRAPTGEAEARFSTSFCVASTLFDGELGLNSFDSDAIARPDLRELERRVDIAPYPLPEGAGDMSPKAPDRLILTLHSGDVLETSVARVRGGPAKPMSLSETLQKLVQAGGDAAQADQFLNSHSNAPFTAPIRMIDHEHAHSFA